MEKHSPVCGVIDKGNSLDAPEASALTAVNVSALLCSAIRRCEHKLESVGREIRYEPSYWSKVLAGERGILLERLGELPLDVQQEWIGRWADAIGASRQSSESDLAELITSRRVRLTIEAL